MALSRGYVERCVGVWQRRLGLQAWHVAVDWDEPARENADASTWRSNDYDRATVHFDAGWPSWSREFLNRIVAHELLHLLMRDVDELVRDVQDQLHRDVATQVERRYEHESEGLVDRLAYRLVEIGGCV